MLMFGYVDCLVSGGNKWDDQGYLLMAFYLLPPCVYRYLLRRHVYKVKCFFIVNCIVCNCKLRLLVYTIAGNSNSWLVN
jgi:hypothetical protein